MNRRELIAGRSAAVSLLGVPGVPSSMLLPCLNQVALLVDADRTPPGLGVIPLKKAVEALTRFTSPSSPPS